MAVGSALRARPRAGDECWISVDVEASGPSPGTGSLLSIGACVVGEDNSRFYVEIQPLPDRPWRDEAEQIHRLSREHLAAMGLEPDVAVEKFAAWVESVSAGRRSIFVGVNAAFDWMFVCDYFHRFGAGNPFGYMPLDLLAYGAGRLGLRQWHDADESVPMAFPTGQPHTHNALDDAIEQGVLAELIADREAPI